MRHGNSSSSEYSLNSGTYSDPTYEAWKPYLFNNPTYDCIEFRSYLRGMETFYSPLFFLWVAHSDPTYEAWKQRFQTPGII